MTRTSYLSRAAIAALCATTLASCTPLPVPAAVETDPVPSAGDAADDPAIWLHPSDPAASTIIGTDKLGGLGVYDLAGNELQYIARGRPNNVDVRYGFPLDGALVDLVVLSDRDLDEISVFTVDASTGLVDPTPVGSIPTAYDPHGICLYKSPVDGAFYAFVNSKTGIVEQWRLDDDGGTVVGAMVRTFNIVTQPEGCVADDELARFYIGEEAAGIWRFGAEPGDGDDRVLVDETGPDGALTADVEGLTIYYASDGTGYLIAASQGDATFAVYEREGDNAYRISFEVVASGPVDGVSTPDGVDVLNVNLGPAFPDGLFVTQDDVNDGLNQNFKLVDWRDIAEAPLPQLTIDTTWDPRS